ncbi:hypothetical protein GEMRC1_010983 [Eukaryota sp. GEM-RC1]
MSSRRKEPLVPETEESVDSSDFESDPSEDGCLSEDRSPTSHKVVDVQPEGGCPSEDGRTSSSRKDGEVDRIPSLLEKYRVSDADSSSTPHSESHDVVVTASPLPILPRRNSFNKESIPDVVPVPQKRSTEVVEEIRKLQESFAKQQSRKLEAEQKLLFEKELLARKMSLSPEDRGNKVVLCGIDNGTEFANAIFEAICNLLAIEVSRSIPHFSQSNGLVERRHRDVLQSLRRLLVDFNDYDNWSTYIPTVQLQINATKSSITGHTPYELMFGCDISPGADPSSLLDAVEKSTKNVPFIDDIKTKLERLTKQREEAEDRQSVLKPKKKSNTSQSFKIGDLVLKVVKTSKLHGNYTGPFLVVSVDSKSLFH